MRGGGNQCATILCMRFQLRCLALTASAQGAVPQSAHLEAEDLHTRPVAGHGEVARCARHHRTQVLALLGDGPVHSLSQLVLDRVQLGPQSSWHWSIARP